MKTILENLDYSTDWTFTGLYRDGRKVYRKELSKALSTGSSTQKFASPYARNIVGDETYFLIVLGGTWKNGFNISNTYYFYCWIADSTNLIAFNVSEAGTAYIVIYGW